VSVLSSLSPVLLVVAPLAVAAGLDLYLTLLLLGASPTIGLWEHPLPGALGDLDSPGVLLVVGTMYLLEFMAERYAPAALVWNMFHAVIRPVSGALLALLILDGQPLGIVVAGCVASAALASIAHAIRSGWAVIRWLGVGSSPGVLLVSLLEDAIVLGLVALCLDAPAWALGATAVLMVAASTHAGSSVRAFWFAASLAAGRVFQTFRRRRWRGPDELPPWVRAVLEDDDVLAPGGALRGSPVGSYRLRGPRFIRGWVLVRGGAPVFVSRYRGKIDTATLDVLGPDAVHERAFFHRVDVRSGTGTPGCVFFSLDGPSAASLRAEFVSGYG